MRIGFSVKNFRSFRDECSFSLLASNYYKENVETLLTEDIPGLSGVRVLPVSAIYGPNASGKSTLMNALGEMRNAVLAARGPQGNPAASYQPFMLDDVSQAEPTTFSIEFCTLRSTENTEKAKLVRYSYAFSFTQEGVEYEELRAHFSKMPRRLFMREKCESGETIIEGSPAFPIPSEVKNLIGSHILILSFFSQADRAKAGEEARVVTDWFRDSLTFVDRSPDFGRPIDMYSGEVLDGARGTDYQRNLIRKIMNEADAGLASVEVEHIPISSMNFPEELLGIMSEEAVKEIKAQSAKHVAFKHQGSGGPRKLSKESSGTLQLFRLSGFVARTLELGGVLLVDELDASLHPDLASAVVSLFLDRGINKNGAQLIFTAHNPCLMSNKLMRRDEFWITEKNEDGASVLYPISDFKVRKGESVQAAYLQGRYSGVPQIPACFGLGASGARSRESGE